MATTKVVSALAPVWAWLRLDLRRRWRSLTVLALLVALACGVVMAATAGARRGGSAVDRLLAPTLPATAMVLPNQPGFDWEPVRKLPGVAAVGTFIGLTGFQVDGLPEDAVDAQYADTETMRTLERPVVLAGRLADPARADEAVVTAAFLTHFHHGIGDTVVARLYSPEQVRSGADGAPAGPRQPLRIVGVVRSQWFIDAAGQGGRIIVTAAFTAKYRANLSGPDDFANALVRLTDGEAGLPAFQRAFATLSGRDDVEIENLAEKARAEKRVTGFERDALLGFALAALLASVVLVGQTVARYAAVSAVDLRVLRTLGLSSRQAVLAVATGPGLAAVAGVVSGAVAAVGVSPLFPIGEAARFEPDPGMRADLPAYAGVAGLVVVLVVSVAAAVTWLERAPNQAAGTPRRSVVAAAAYRSGLPVQVVVGARFALEPGRGRAAVPVRPALVGAMVGVLGVMAALTFRAGVVDAAGNPARFGQTFQLRAFSGLNGQEFGPPPRPVQEAWALDPDVVAVNDTRIGVVTVGRTPVTVFSYAPVGKQPLPVVTLSGRMPTAADEIALAPRSVHNIGVKIGDVVTVARRGAEVRLRVTGTVFVPEDSHNTYAEGAWLTEGGYQRLFPRDDFKFHETHLALRPGADVAAVTKRLTAVMVDVAGGPVMGLDPSPAPIQVTQVRNVRVLPLALGLFLGLLAVGATGHALATAVRRRRQEVAVLRALGMTRRQSRLIVVTQAAVLAVVGLALGVPLGVALGRTMWRAVADSTPLLYEPPVAVLALVLVVPVALLVGNVLAALPARRAARLRVGDVLRAD